MQFALQNAYYNTLKFTNSIVCNNNINTDNQSTAD